MAGLLSIVKRFPLLFFFTLCFGISWTLWLVSLPLYPLSSTTAALVGTLGLFGPLTSALIVQSITKKNDASIELSEIFKTLGPVLLVLIFAGLLGYTHAGMFRADFYAGSLIIGTAGYFLYRMFKRTDVLNTGCTGRPGQKNKWLWPVFALLLPPLLAAGVMCFSRLTGSPVSRYPFIDSIFSVAGFWRLLLVFCGTLLYLGPLGEEPGWRGFALPQLLKSHSPLIASIIIGLVWTLWHLPVDLAGRNISMVPEALLARLGITLPGSVIFTWLYLGSGRSLVSCMILHASLNTTWICLLPPGYALHSLLPPAIIIILFSGMWRKRS